MFPLHHQKHKKRQIQTEKKHEKNHTKQSAKGNIKKHANFNNVDFMYAIVNRYTL
jgi:hypothetical protein